MGHMRAQAQGLQKRFGGFSVLAVSELPRTLSSEQFLQPTSLFTLNPFTSTSRQTHRRPLCFRSRTRGSVAACLTHRQILGPLPLRS